MARPNTPAITKEELLRRGPIRVESGVGQPTHLDPFPSIKTDRDLIRDSVLMILCTRRGEYLMLPDFGTRLHDTLWEPNDAFSALVEEDIADAIIKWEPRVSLIGVQARPSENSLLVNIDMIIKRLNQPMNLPLEIVRDRGVEL